uniref:Uncharacterized protein n=1 Tax=Arundo donax TaxID=35708 RepID=A0A0A9ABF5_ARUDO
MPRTGGPSHWKASAKAIAALLGTVTRASWSCHSAMVLLQDHCNPRHL